MGEMKTITTEITDKLILEWLNDVWGNEKVLLKIDNATLNYPRATKMIRAIEDRIRNRGQL